MQLLIIIKEIRSPALREVASSVIETIKKIRSGSISHQQASVEIASHKYLLRTIALDWLYHKHLLTTLPPLETYRQSRTKPHLLK